ncbi:UNVERIFIED_CONTAM: hypothetical protein Sangu_1747700 [Sesamum angustifolium]|uniref:Uncharacterized protein n=1 Tax=Sesamum angustifolium TaxID=2727405 RepID=A0AAW2M8K9_9LAMI
MVWMKKGVPRADLGSGWENCSICRRRGRVEIGCLAELPLVRAPRALSTVLVIQPK